jgi:hypothetical protein
MDASEANRSASEVIFLVEEAPEGGFTARAGLHVNVRDAVRGHFDDDKAPRIIRLHFVREEIITA